MQRLLISLALVGALLAGCATSSTGGKGKLQVKGTNVVWEVAAPKDGASATPQTFRTVSEVETLTPGGTIVEEKVVSFDIPTGKTNSVTYRTNHPSPVVLTNRTVNTVEANATFSPPKVDTTKTTALAYKSFNKLQYAGIGLIVLGLLMFWGPVRAVVGSSTLAFGCIGAGFACIAFGHLVIAYGNWIMAALIAGPVIYYFVHRHGKLQGMVDANKNGIPDKYEPITQRSPRSRRKNTRRTNTTG